MPKPGWAHEAASSPANKALSLSFIVRKRGGLGGLLGVSWIARKGRRLAQLRHDGQYHSLGYFDAEEEAAHAYDAAILPLAGEFARLNFPLAA
jgi:hypothetical protein